MATFKRPIRVLILYTKIGGGHESIAYGLGERMKESLGKEVEVILEDPTNSSTGFAYQVGATYSPQLFNLSYNFLNTPVVTKIWRGIQSFFNTTPPAENSNFIDVLYHSPKDSND